MNEAFVFSVGALAGLVVTWAIMSARLAYERRLRRIENGAAFWEGYKLGAKIDQMSGGRRAD